ncbi:DedA family protein [Alicyclobacillus cycloheptanicus]|uniref:Membrane protein DedA with SNARE-associated domain n=1 Tax=Alicyclobacillus cycloheptanicus TaxID=1457 RepID=A0ABT9XIE2_9BACL|nr:DedA family protein [Alicyclobacillus cycloheptanicus]MDQ0190065.1 membrane protein DedA with SNARE-associated domain [Alicyclobacillus cycloheptanicus]WDM02045.1 DedA family protein [Alicyclobacillus cycloheptanicus]
MWNLFGALARDIFALGYPGIALALIIEGLGLPFPGDAVMVLYGYAAAEGHFALPGVILCSIAGYLMGTSVAYWTSYYYGPELGRLVDRLPVFNKRSMMRTTRLIDKYGAFLLIPGRFVPGIRSVTSYVAGFSRMDLRLFLLYTGISACLWCSTWVAAGYWFGENATLMMHTLQSYFAYIVGIGALVGLIWWLARRPST